MISNSAVQYQTATVSPTAWITVSGTAPAPNNIGSTFGAVWDGAPLLVTNLNTFGTFNLGNPNLGNGTSIQGDDNAQTITLNAGNGFSFTGGTISTAGEIVTPADISASRYNDNASTVDVIIGTNWTSGANSLPASSLDNSAMPIATVAAITTTNLNFTLIATNFLGNRLYTNFYGAPIQVTANAVLTPAAVAGGVAEAIQVRALTANGGATNTSGLQTTILSIVMSYTNVVTAYVPTNAVYCFTNLSTGTGNSASVQGGQIFVY